MTRAKVEREVAAAVLGGDQPVPKLLRAGLITVARVRERLHEALESAFERSGTRDYVWTALPRGGKLIVHLRAYQGGSHKRVPLITLVRARSGKRDTAFGVEVDVNMRAPRPAGSVELLTERLGSDATAIVRSMLAIERARKQCYALAEEVTRWL